MELMVIEVDESVLASDLIFFRDRGLVKSTSSRLLRMELMVIEVDESVMVNAEQVIQGLMCRFYEES